MAERIKVLVAYGLIEVVTDRGTTKTRHLADARHVPVSEVVWAVPVGCRRELYLTRARPEHADAPVCRSCWATRPGLVAVRLVGSPADVTATLARIRTVLGVAVCRPRPVRDSRRTHIDGFVTPPGREHEGEVGQ